MPTPRNVIWITTDHMRYDCIAAHGNPVMHTPNLDRLVEGGVSFDRCYANNPLCMPSRCSFMTGCYPQQTGVTSNGQELPPDFDPTVATVFHGGGFRTVQIGKLHFQNHEDHDLDPRARNSYGFDVFELSEEAGCYEDAYRTWLRGEYPDLVRTFTVPRPVSYERRNESRTPRVLDAPWQASHSGWIATQFDRYFASWGLREDPQFVHLGFYAPHPPLNPTREMFAPYESVEIPPPARRATDPRDVQSYSDAELDAYRRHFFAMVTGVDLAVGRVIEVLERNGELEDTLVVFGSDHGDACGDHGHTGKGPSYFESVMRLPLVLHWPRGFPRGGMRVPGLFEMIDLLPTLTELCGIPRHRSFQGRSVAAELCSGVEPDGREDVYAFHGCGQIMLRSEETKYLTYIDTQGSRELLFDLEKDPDEFVDRAADPRYRERLEAMRTRAFHRTVAATTSLRERIHRF